MQFENEHNALSSDNSGVIHDSAHKLNLSGSSVEHYETNKELFVDNYKSKKKQK